ncbi:RHS repeat domain-containing protein, partial [Erwinia sp. B116]|uniref:RHS repeat domain-containing protein n=1 Tax=Erwinia sp. B116 TaxID=1561024 RepID=UPI0011AFBA5B
MTTQQTSNQPVINGLQMDGGNPGDIDSSVNLFRGDVNFPLNILSLNGRNGLKVDVNIFYQSNIHNQVTRWNQSAPTDLLGVGWSLAFDRIVVDGGTTGAPEDNSYYLIVDGATVALYRTGYSSVNGLPVLTFQSREFAFWTIRYHPRSDSPEQEYWEIVKDNGERLTFGLHGIQWGVKWKNWIGATTDTSGTRFPQAWNLVRIDNSWNDYITFAYQNDDLPLGNNPATCYTRACHITRISDASGRSVAFNYQQKSPAEIQLPHVAPGAVNAWQFRYETRYLDSIVVSNASQQTLFTTEFSYALLNVSAQPQNDRFSKRYLTAIRQSNYAGAALPGIEFDYWQEAGAANPGALKSITRPYGGVVSYDYSVLTLASSSTRATLKSPGNGYTPRVWPGNDFTVVGWYNEGLNKAIFSVWSWGGSWQSWQSDALSNLNIEQLQITTGRDFFVVWFRDLNLQRYRVLLYKQSPWRAGEWQMTEVKLDNGFKTLSLCTGDNFVALHASDATQLIIRQWDGLSRQWLENRINTGSYDRVALCGVNNVCLAAFYDQSRQSLTLRSFYGDQLRQWHAAGQQQYNVPIDWSLTRPESFWSIAPGGAVATYIKTVDENTASYDFMMVRWREDYQFQPASIYAYQQDKSLGNPIGYSISTDTVFGNGAHVFRFSGQKWNDNRVLDPKNGNDYRYAYGSDLALAVEKSGSTAFVSSRIFDPYQQQWTNGPIAFNAGGTGSLVSPSISGDICIVKKRIYGKDARGQWQLVTTLPDNVDERTIQNRSPDYIAWQLQNDSSTWVLFLQDGQIAAPAVKLLNHKIFVPDGGSGTVLAGGNAFITYQSDEFSRAGELFLHRVINQSVDRQQVSRSVSRAVLNSGYQTVTSHYEYDLQTATCDPQGGVAQYARVKSGRSDPASRLGVTENIFFNGLSPAVAGVNYPESDDFTNVKDYFSLFKGRLFQSISRDAQGQKVAQTSHSLYAWDRTPAGQNIYGVYVRLRKKVETAWLAAFSVESSFAAVLDQGKADTGLSAAFNAAGFSLAAGSPITTLIAGRCWSIENAADRQRYTLNADDSAIQVNAAVDSVVESDFNALGQLANTTTRSFNGEGEEEVKVNTTRYAWEFYPAIQALNLLQLWALKQTFNQSAQAVTALSVRTWNRQWAAGDLWVANKEYSWDGTPGTEVFDFASWSGDNEPPAGWLKTTETHDVTANGLATDITRLDGLRARTLYDRAGEQPVALFSLPANQAPAVSYYGFETYEESGPWQMSDDSPLAAHFCTDDSYTGAHSLQLAGGENAAGLQADFDLAASAETWLLSGWFKPLTSVDAVFSGQLLLTARSGSSVKQLTVSLPGNGGWFALQQRVRAADFSLTAIDTLTVRLVVPVSQQTLLVDHLALAPLAGADKFSAAVYDQRTRERTTALDMLGRVGRTVYDRWQRVVAEIGHNDTPVRFSGEDLWRLRSSTFDPAAPNSTLSQLFQGGGVFNNFRQGNDWQAHWQAQGQWLLNEQGLCHSDGGTASLTLRQRADDQTFSLRLLLDAGVSVSTPLAFSIGDNLHIQGQNGVWQVMDGQQRPLARGTQTLPDAADLWLSLTEFGLLLLVNGEVVLRVPLTGTVAGAVTFTTRGNLTLTSAMAGQAPQTNASYLDNAKRLLQSQSLQQEGLVVGQRIYDALGREAVITRNALFNGELPGWRSGFVSGFDWDSGILQGELATCYPQDQGYPYSRTTFDTTPMSRIRLTGKPGRQYAITGQSDQHVLVTTYATNTASELLSHLPAGHYPLSLATDPDRLPVRQISDKTGRVVARIDGDASSGAGHFALTRYYYDAAGNLVRTELPNYFMADLPGAEKFVQLQQYDFLGRLTQKQQPDTAAPTRYIYDRGNRIRFMQDASGVSEHFLLYWVYDALGRVTEEGSCDADWDAATLQAHADRPDWLPAAGLWRTRRVYDGDGSSAGAIGKLVSVSTSSQGTTPQADVVETFTYDDRGRTATKTLQVPAFDAQTRISQYEYDNLGNRTATRYGEQNATQIRLGYQFDSSGRLSALSRTAEDSPAQLLARYRYNARGALEEKSILPDSDGALTRHYSYNSPGWLTGINDDCFSETLSYEQGYQGAEYYSGRIACIRSQFLTPIPGEGFSGDYQYQYQYDLLGRLTVAANSAEEAYSLGSSAPLAYDANNNITALQRGDRQREYQFYPGTNQLLNTAGDNQQQYAWNASGNLVQALPRGIQAIDYDRHSQQALTVHAAEPWRYQYDSRRQRVLKSGATRQTLYWLDISGALLAVLEKENDRPQQTDYVQDPQGILLFFRQSATYTVLGDHSGSTRLILNGRQPVAAYNYLPFGSLLGAAWEPQGRLIPYLFTGQEFDAELGLYLFKIRFYDSDLGRFYSTDPAAEFASPYTYAGNDPIYFVDPSGQFSIGSFFAI